MEISYKPTLPNNPLPIVIFGAGGIVKDAHLPAYRQAGFAVHGIYNRTAAKAEALAEEYGIPNVYGSIDDAVADAPQDVVWDVALMPPQFVGLLDKLPKGSHVLLQKPMGDDWETTLAIRDACWRRQHQAAVNCQLRFAPFTMAARDLIDRGAIGDLHHMEVHVEVDTPWHLFTHIHGLPRGEIQQHSIHHLDIVRSFLGDPRNMYARTVQHPKQLELASTRTTMILDYGPGIQASVLVNHGHEFGPRHQQSYIKWEGTRGAIKATMGLLKNYPDGEPDTFEYCLLEDGDAKPAWRSVALDGSWFPEAFVGSMAQVMRHREGSLEQMPTRLEDVMRTMACVEAAYASDASGGTPVDYSFATES